MTFVGKILVIVILAFALFFLALSTVVFTSTTNWREAFEKKKAENDKLAQDIQGAQAELTKREEALKAEVGRRDTELDTLQKQAATLQGEIQTLQGQTTDLRTQFEVQQQTAKSAVEEAQALARETGTIRGEYQDSQKQANDLKARQTELNEKIMVLERQLQTAETNNKDLREDLAAYKNFLDSKGLPSDPDQVSVAAGGVIAAPDIEGQVLAVSNKNDVVESSIGSDDGVVAGQEYFVFRTAGASSEFIGKVRITQTEPDRSVGRVVSRYLGRKIAEGDNVAGKIQPRR